MRKILILFGLILFLSVSAQKQFKYKVFANDTSTNTDAVYFTFDQPLDGIYEYSWSFIADSISGTTAGTGYLQQSNDIARTFWTNVSGQTVNINKGVKVFLNGISYGAAQRLYLPTSGTQVTGYSVTACYKNLLSNIGSNNSYIIVTTITNGDTLDIEYPKGLEGRYEYSWQIYATQNTGSTSGTCYLQQTNDRSGVDANYVNVSGKTISLSGTSSGIVEGNTYGTNYRMRIITTGAQSTGIKSNLILRRL